MTQAIDINNSSISPSEKDALETSICKDSFYDFVRRMWSEVISDQPVWNWHIEYLCNELQTVMERAIARKPKEYDLVVNVPPASTKSTIASVMLPAWVWLRDPAFRMICGSYAFPLAFNLAKNTRRVIQSKKYARLFPEMVLEGDAMGMLTTHKGGQRITTSTGGSITGMHGHAIIIDDPIKPDDALSDIMLRGANDWFDQTLMSRMTSKHVTPIILIMQRLHQNDPTGHMLERKDKTPIRHICLPATLSRMVRPRCLRSKYVDGLFDPVRLPKKILEGIEAEQGVYAYAGQYSQRPVPMGGGAFKPSMIQIMESVGRMTRIVRYWDKAGSAKSGTYTVGVLMGYGVDRDFWILDVVRGQWEAAERERIIRQTAIRDTKKVIIYVEQEPGSGGKESAQATVKNLAGFRIRIDRPTGDKELRADPYAQQVNGGNVKMVKGEWNGSYLQEMQFFPYGKYKDQIDASSGAFATLSLAGRKVGVF